MHSLAAVTLLLCVASATYAIPAAELRKALNSVKDNDGQIYVLLVAGSNTWMNYRHQVVNTSAAIALMGASFRVDLLHAAR